MTDASAPPETPADPPARDLADAPPRSAEPAVDHFAPGYDPVEGVPDAVTGEVTPPPGHDAGEAGPQAP